MAEHVGMHAAKTHFSRLVQRARNGAEVIVERSGHPVAKIVAYDEPSGILSLRGIWKGHGAVPDDFNQLPEDLQRAFGMLNE